MRCLGAGAASPAPTRREEEGLPGFRVERQAYGQASLAAEVCSQHGVPQGIDRGDDDRCHSSPGELAPPRKSSMDTVYVVWHAD